MNENELDTIPTSEYRLNQELDYNYQRNFVTSRFYDPDKQQWFYSLNNNQTLITKNEITQWWMDKFSAENKPRR